MYSSDANEASPRGFVKPSEKSSENEGSILANEFTISPHYVSEQGDDKNQQVLEPRKRRTRTLKQVQQRDLQEEKPNMILV